jgi:hypothetical protein
VDLRAPLDHVVDPVQVTEALERTRLVLLGKVAEDEDTQCHMSITLHKFYDAHGVASAEPAHGLWRGQGLEGRGHGGHALNCGGRGCAQRAGRGGRAHQDLPSVAGQGSQAH